MSVDPERLRSLLDRLRATEKELARLRSLGADALHEDVDRLNSVKYLFVVAAEIAIDVGQHIIVAEGLPAPESFAEVFDILGREGWLSEELALTDPAASSFKGTGAAARCSETPLHGQGHRPRPPTAAAGRSRPRRGRRSPRGW